jgi:hypothetical protein
MIAFGWCGSPSVGVLVFVLVVTGVVESFGSTFWSVVAAFPNNINHPRLSYFFPTKNFVGLKPSPPPISFLQTFKLYDTTNSDDDDDETTGVQKHNNLSNFVNNSSNAASPSDGQDLAKEFYRQIQQRQYDDSVTKDNTELMPRQGLTKDQVQSQNAQPFSKPRRPVSTSTSSSNSNSSMNETRFERKYTGQSDSLLFGNIPFGKRDQGSSSSSSNNNNNYKSPTQSMMEREFELAGRGAGLGLAVQAVVVVVVLIFYIYVGLSGGIVSGDVDSSDFGDGSRDGLEYETIITAPLLLPPDSEKSVWL